GSGSGAVAVFCGIEAECRPSGNPGVFPVTGRDQRNLLAALVHAASGQPIADLAKKRLEHGRNTAAHNHDIRFQQVNDVAEPERQQFHRLLQDLAGGSISRRSGFADHFAGKAVKLSSGEIEKAGAPAIFEFGARSAGNRRARGENFDAAWLTTAAARSLVVNAHVPTLGGCNGAATI